MNAIAVSCAVPSQRPLHATGRSRHRGLVDFDGHILEPPDLWESYIDPKFRDRAIRVRTNEKGLEYLEYDGKPSAYIGAGGLSLMGCMHHDNPMALASDPESTYLGEHPFGSMDPRERIKMLDAEGIDAVVLYTTIGLLWESEVEDPELSQAYTRAYNRWICEFCSYSPRLLPVAHISLTDVDAAAKELERAVKEGARSAMIGTFTHEKLSVADPKFSRFFATAQDLGVPVAIHPMIEPRWASDGRFGNPQAFEDFSFVMGNLVAAGHGVRRQFASLFDHALFDRFPTLKILVVESGGGWIGHYLDRMDALYERTPVGKGAKLKHKPSDYLREGRFIMSADPDERTVPDLAARYGADNFVWASDFPHFDHTPAYIESLDGLLDLLPPGDREKVAGGNAKNLYGIDERAVVGTR
jgi:predicted TIM-barrel fold metal-dependent hydrolase